MLNHRYITGVIECAGEGLKPLDHLRPVDAGDAQPFGTAGGITMQSGLDGLQNVNDLVFGESGFTHGDLFRGHNQYVGRSLKVNGSFCMDTYTACVSSSIY